MEPESLIESEDPGTEIAFRAVPELHSSLIPLAKVIQVPAGEIIFRRGTSAVGIYIVLEGRARLTMPDERGSEMSTGFRTVGAGSIIGLPAVLCSIPYIFTARATERSRVGFIEAGRLNEFLRERTELCMQVVQMMSRELSAIKQAREKLNTCKDRECALSGSCRTCN